MIDASKFAKPRFDADGKGQFLFGSDNATMAQAFRSFADAIEQGRIAVQSVQFGQVLSADNYFMSALYIEFAEKGEDLATIVARSLTSA